MDLNAAGMTSGTVGLASHLLATASPAIRLASQAVALLPDASRIADATEKLVASAEAVNARAQQADREEVTAAANDLLSAASTLAQSVAAFIGRANEVAVSVSRLRSPAVRLASFAEYFLAAVAPGTAPPSQAPPPKQQAREATYLTESEVDRLLTQKLDQTLSEFRKEMEEFKQSGRPESEGAPSQAENTPHDNG
jgi:uncharacterized protein YhaN